MYFLGREVLLVCVTRTTEYAQLDKPRRIKPISDGSPLRRVEAAMPLGVQLLHPPPNLVDRAWCPGLRDVEMADFTIATMPGRFAELGDLHAGIDDAVWSIEPLLD